MSASVLWLARLKAKLADARQLQPEQPMLANKWGRYFHICVKPPIIGIALSYLSASRWFRKRMFSRGTRFMRAFINQKSVLYLACLTGLGTLGCVAMGCTKSWTTGNDRTSSLR